MRTFSMKTTAVIMAALAAFSLSEASAATKSGTKKKKVQASQSVKSQNLSRDIVFDGADVNGRYHSAGEAVAKVETEKQMNDLIGVRRDFKDRLAMERDRLKSGQAVTK